MSLEGLPQDIPQPINCPFTTEPFVRAEITFSRPTRDVHFLPPAPPLGWIYEDTDDGPIFVRKMTDDEKAAELQAFDKAYEKWKQTHGRARIAAGPEVIHGRFFTASGAVAEAMLDNGQWYWESFDSSRSE